jgi:hypothetical protein
MLELMSTDLQHIHGFGEKTMFYRIKIESLSWKPGLLMEKNPDYNREVLDDFGKPEKV